METAEAREARIQRNLNPRIADTHNLMDKLIREQRLDQILGGQSQSEARTLRDFEAEQIPPADVARWAKHADHVTVNVCANGRKHTENAARIVLDKVVFYDDPKLTSVLPSKTAVANIAHIYNRLEYYSREDGSFESRRLREQMRILTLKATQQCISE